MNGFLKQVLLVNIASSCKDICIFSFCLSDLRDYDRQNDGPPKVVPVLNPRTCKCVTLYSKRDFANMIKLKILRWKECLELFRLSQYIKYIYIYCFINTPVVDNCVLMFLRRSLGRTKFKTHEEAKSVYIKCFLPKNP